MIFTCSKLNHVASSIRRVSQSYNICSKKVLIAPFLAAYKPSKLAIVEKAKNESHEPWSLTEKFCFGFSNQMMAGQHL